MASNLYIKAPSGTVGAGDYRGEWVSTGATTYAVGDKVVSKATSNYYVYECTTAGTTASGTEPSWVNTTPDVSTTTTGTATFTTRIPTTWTNATISMGRLTNNDAAGDVIYIDYTATVTEASSNTLLLSGTITLPSNVLSVDSSSQPPTTYQQQTGAISYSAAVMTMSGIGTVTGLVFSSGSSTTTYSVTTDGTDLHFKSCKFRATSTGGSAGQITIGGTSVKVAVTYEQCAFKYASAAGKFAVTSAKFTLNNCSYETGTTSPTSMFSLSQLVDVLVKDCDFSNLSSAVSLLGTSNASGKVDVINTKFPSGWTTLGTRPAQPNFELRMFNCFAGATPIVYQKYTAAGDILYDSSTRRDGGATEGTTPFSWQFVTQSTASELANPLVSDVITIPVTAGTFNINVDLTSSTALTNAEAWIEIDYEYGNVSTKRATTLTTATTIPSSSGITWTSGAASTQTITQSVTSTQDGNVYVKVYVSKPSATVWVNPKAYVS